MTMAEAQDRITVHIDPDLEALIPKYLKNRHNDINSIMEAVDRGDFETALTLGHSMKGSGGGYGFDDITGIGAKIERAAKEQDTEAIVAQVKELKSYLERVEVVFREE